ncbi:hypothetical protein [Haloechinothrix halophila]|uniref:hypothetical protein n=1 Tax=Haloechinothrix halophila TaxID=1069073 RepID=UPI0005516684|nr:hypothetical protein [Haloechinothrix halophila]
MRKSLPQTDLLLTLMGAPHADDTLTDTLRLVQALLDSGTRVSVWACGYATLLTQRALGECKPRNPASWDTEYPSTAAIIATMLAAHPEHLYWYGCRFCSDDRGADDHLAEVVMRPPARYAENVAAAGKTLVIGVM